MFVVAGIVVVCAVAYVGYEVWQLAKEPPISKADRKAAYDRIYAKTDLGAVVRDDVQALS